MDAIDERRVDELPLWPHIERRRGAHRLLDIRRILVEENPAAQLGSEPRRASDDAVIEAMNRAPRASRPNHRDCRRLGIPAFQLDVHCALGRDGVEHLLEARNEHLRRELDARELVPADLTYGAKRSPASSRDSDLRVVMHHRNSVCGCMHVQLDRVGAPFERAGERRQAILGEFSLRAPMTYQLHALRGWGHR